MPAVLRKPRTVVREDVQPAIVRIANLRQRVELVHGTLAAGPAPDGGFCLEATLPAYVPTAEPVG